MLLNTWDGKVAIPFKWGQSFYPSHQKNGGRLSGSSQSLLNEVKVSTVTLSEGDYSTAGYVAIPFKWGQSFYGMVTIQVGTPAIVSQSLLNEVKVSTRWITRSQYIPSYGSQSLLNEVKVSTKCVEYWPPLWVVAIPFKWGQSFYEANAESSGKSHSESQSLLNEVKVSTMYVTKKAIALRMSQSLLNEVKVST